jgi:hypothetical protein
MPTLQDTLFFLPEDKRQYIPLEVIKILPDNMASQLRRYNYL